MTEAGILERSRILFPGFFSPFFFLGIQKFPRLGVKSDQELTVKATATATVGSLTH